jgi:hypothetical protein
MTPSVRPKQPANFFCVSLFAAELRQPGEPLARILLFYLFSVFFFFVCVYEVLRSQNARVDDGPDKTFRVLIVFVFNERTFLQEI